MYITISIYTYSHTLWNHHLSDKTITNMRRRDLSRSLFLQSSTFPFFDGWFDAFRVGALGQNVAMDDFVEVAVEAGKASSR